MKNLKYLGKRGLALFLSLVLCLGLVPGTAAAAEGKGTKEEPYDVVVYDGEPLKDALNRIDGVATADNWYHYASHTGRANSNVAEYGANKYIPLLNGKTTENEPSTQEWTPASNDYTVYYKQSESKWRANYYKYTYPAAGEGTYQVSSNEDGNNPIWVTVSYKTRVVAQVTLNNDEKVMLVYNKELTDIDWDAVAERILVERAVFTTPRGDLANVRVEYRSEEVGDVLDPWKLVADGGMSEGLSKTTGYKIRIAWDANGTYAAGTAELGGLDTIKFIDRAESKIAVRNNPVVDLDNAEDVNQAVFEAVVDSANSIPNTLTCADVEITGVPEPGFIGEKTENVMIKYLGSTTQKPTEATASVTFKGAKPAAPVTMDTTAPVDLVFKMDNGSVVVDETAVAAKVLALVKSGDADKFTLHSDQVTLSGTYAEGTQTITVGYPAVGEYASFSGTFDVTFQDNRTQGNITLKAGTTTVNPGEESLQERIFAAAVVTGSTPEGLSARDVKIEYCIDRFIVEDEWKGLDDSMPKDKDVKIRFSWGGDATYKGFENVECTVHVLSKRASSIEKKSFESIKLVYDDDGNLLVRETEQKIFDTVVDVERSEPDTMTLEDVTIEYYATDEKLSVGSLGKDWISLNGGKKGIYTYPAIFEGTQKVRITFKGDTLYKESSIEIETTFTGRLDSKVVLNNGTMVYTPNTDEIKAYIFTNCVDASSEIPSGLSYTDLTYQYKSNLAIVEDLGDLGSFNLGSLISGLDKLPGDIGNIDLNKIFKESWVPFEGASVKDVVSGTISDSTGGIIQGDTLGSAVDKILEGIAKKLAEKLGISDEEAMALLERYPTIGAGEQTIRAIYTKGNSEYKPGVFSDETPTAILTITKAPAKATVNSGVRNVKDVQAANGLPGFITTEPEGVGTVTVYAGLNKDAKPVIYVDLSQADSVFKYLPKLLGVEDGVNAADLYRKLKDNTQWLEKIGISSDITGKLIDAIAGLIQNDTISGIISGNRDGIADLINKGLGSAGNAIEKMGDVTVYFRAPKEAGLYGVASFVSDKNYEANPNIAAGYLVISMDAIKVTVGNAKINVGDGIPEGFITTEPHTDNVCVIYAGLPAGVWLDVPEAYRWNDVTTVGQLREKLNAEASSGTAAVGLDYKVINKLLEVVTGLGLGEIDKAPVHYGVPTGTAGAYTVTAIASNGGTDIPGMGVGSLVVGLKNEVAVKVNSKIIEVDDEFPSDLVVTTPTEARTLALYAGVSAGDGTLTGKLYIDGLNGAPETMTLDELRKRIAGNPMREDYQIISAILEKLPETKAGSWTVITDKPPVEAGTYTVVAGAVMEGSVPAVDMGTLTVVDRNITVITYKAGAGGSVSRTSETVTSTNEVQGSVATPNEGYHFVNWTNTIGQVVGTDKELKTVPEGWDKFTARYTANFEKCDEEGVFDHKDATCTEDGYTIVKCSVCGAEGRTIVIPSLGGHKWALNETTKAPTCTEEGTGIYKCENVRCTETKTDSIPATGHTMTEVPGVPMSCITNTPGKTVHWYCSVCGGNFEDRIGNTVWTEESGTIPVQHTVSTSSIIPEVPATCLGTGTLAHWHCAVCGKDFSDPACTMELTELTIPAKGHTEVEIPAVPATCTTDGTAAGTKCSVCQTVIRQPEATPATGHNWVTDQTVESTSCPGTTVHHQHCGNPNCTATRTLADSPVGHTPADSGYIAPTCTTTGSVGGTYCTVCQAVIEANEAIPALGHDYADVITGPTCTADGYTTHTCIRCGNSYQDASTGKLGHSFTNYVSNNNAKCEENGTETARCDRCNETDTRIIANSATGHTEVIDAAVEATCEGTGLTAGSHCSVCNKKLAAQEVVPAKGHTEATDAAVEATCTEAGKTEGKHCSVCGTVITAQTEVPALGHDYVLTATVQPGAYTNGSRTYTCTHDASHTRTEVIPATGAGTETDTGSNPWNTPTIPTVTPGGGTINIPNNQVPLNGNTPDDDSIDIGEDDVPLGMLPSLNSTDHIAYLKGYSDGTVRPMSNITRAEVATIFYRLMTDAYRDSVYATTHSFTDAPASQWYNEAISTAANAGILKGYLDGTVRPDNYITRAEFVTIAANFLFDDGEGGASFTDIQGHWAEADIRRVAAAGWIKGDGDGKFRPDGRITRAEAVTIINRILERATESAEMMDDMVTWPDSKASDWWYIAIQEATNGHDYESGYPERWTTLR